MLVIDSIPPFQRALQSPSAKDDIIVVQGRCARTITHSWRDEGLCHSILVPLRWQSLGPHIPEPFDRKTHVKGKGFALDAARLGKKLGYRRFLGLGVGEEGEVVEHRREGRGGETEGEREILVFDSEQKLLLQHWLEICNQLKSGKVF